MREKPVFQASEAGEPKGFGDPMPKSVELGVLRKLAFGATSRTRNGVKMWTTIRNRVFADFLMGSRLDEYSELLALLKSSGYHFESLGGFYHAWMGNHKYLEAKCIVLRHDIDTGSTTAAKMFEIEQAQGVKSTFFFRLGTSDRSLMDAINSAGGEVGYHYEEVATYAKAHAITSATELRRQMPKIRVLFADNLARLREYSGLQIETAASHGDFVNRALGMFNTEILASGEFRKKVGICLEAYDVHLRSQFQSLITDTAPPNRWKEESPLECVARGDLRIHILVHPRAWRSERSVNFRDDVWRLFEGACFRCGIALKILDAAVAREGHRVESG